MKSQSVTSKVKATEQFSPVVLYNLLHKLVDEIPSATIQVKGTEHYFPVALFLLCKVVLIFESVDQTLKSDHSNES